jgi:hypothetical protein
MRGPAGEAQSDDAVLGFRPDAVVGELAVFALEPLHQVPADVFDFAVVLDAAIRFGWRRSCLALELLNP